jgi:hypothetical protein
MFRYRRLCVVLHSTRVGSLVLGIKSTPQVRHPGHATKSGICDTQATYTQMEQPVDKDIYLFNHGEQIVVVLNPSTAQGGRLESVTTLTASGVNLDSTH